MSGICNAFLVKLTLAGLKVPLILFARIALSFNFPILHESCQAFKNFDDIILT